MDNLQEIKSYKNDQEGPDPENAMNCPNYGGIFLRRQRTRHTSIY